MFVSSASPVRTRCRPARPGAFSTFISRIKLDVLDLDVLMAFADEHEDDASAWF
jgi:hypothetical protein